MNKSFFFSSIFLLMSITSYGQALNIDYFEVSAEKSAPPEISYSNELVQQWREALADTAIIDATIMIAISNATSSDQLELKIVDSRGITVYQTSYTISQWLANNADRTAAGVMYLTIQAGAYPYLKHFTATALLTSGGISSEKSYNR